MKKRLDIFSCSQLRKVSNRKNQCEDRLSCLPDEILYFIQSFLECEEVTQMSILSRRWLNLWKDAPVLQFGVPILLDQHLCAPIVTDRRNQKPECDNIVSTISPVVYDDGSLELKPKRECDELSCWLHDERSQKKQECDNSAFWMTCHTPDERKQKGECDKIINWMSRVSKMHKGQNSNELKVSYTLYKCYKKDIDSWWEDTLVKEYQKLELDFLSIDRQDSSYVFPDRLLSFCSVCLLWTLSFDSHFLESSGFKSLKSLSLKGILITYKSTDFILINCPFLERLEVVESPVLAFFQIKDGKSLALKHLKIEDCVNLRFIDIVYSNVVSLKISAPLWISLKKLPRLIELSIIDGAPDKCRRDSLCQPELKTLTLNPAKPKALLEQFNLISQLVKLQRFVVLVDALGDESLTGLIAFINACPLLKEFVLMLHWVEPCRSNKMLTEKPGKCSHKHLKVAEFLGYYGRVSDVELIVHLIENADNLEKVIIDPWNPQHDEHDYEEEEEARTLALLQLKDYVPPLVQFIIR